jgi:hypothetical protein
MKYLAPIIFLVVVCVLMIGLRREEFKLTEGIQPGNLAPEIEWQDIDLKGSKFVLLQFWATHDVHSRMLNAQMHNAISGIKTDDIRLVSVSMDENEAVFEGVVKAERLDPATQFNDPRGKNSEIFKAYRLKSGFSNWLIGPEGVIIAKNLKPGEIFAYIEN